MVPVNALDNPYWDALRAGTAIPVDAASLDWTAVGPLKALPAYREFCAFRYAMTITDPATVTFVTMHANGRVIDPLAGTGYWTYLLRQAGIDVHACDLNPSDQTYVPVITGDAAPAAARTPDRTLLLSWPPYEGDVGERTLRAYRGARVIYLGEDFGGCCGSDTMFDLLRDEWTEVAAHTPIQWPGSRDHVTVFDRPASRRGLRSPTRGTPSSRGPHEHSLSSGTAGRVRRPASAGYDGPFRHRPAPAWVAAAGYR
jgi:hypothetical protein